MSLLEGASLTHVVVYVVERDCQWPLNCLVVLSRLNSLSSHSRLLQVHSSTPLAVHTLVSFVIFRVV